MFDVKFQYRRRYREGYNVEVHRLPLLWLEGFNTEDGIGRATTP